MFDHRGWISYHPGSIWSETNEKWNEADGGWRAVGVAPTRFVTACERSEEKEAPVSFAAMLPRKWYSVVEFPSGRLEVGHHLSMLEVGTYVILEADRGEDCGRIVWNMSESEFEGSVPQGRDAKSELEPKKILRRASADDLNKLRQRKEIEAVSLQRCRELVAARRLSMEILSCEYQWDMRKITFYFKSDKRIDFRDLLKELFKLFKVRIWMCAERRTNNDVIKRMVG